MQRLCERQKASSFQELEAVLGEQEYVCTRPEFKGHYYFLGE